MRESTSGEGQKKERQNPKQAPCHQHRARHGARTHELQDHDLSQNQQSDAQPAVPPRHPQVTYNLTKEFTAYLYELLEVFCFLFFFRETEGVGRAEAEGERDKILS